MEYREFELTLCFEDCQVSITGAIYPDSYIEITGFSTSGVYDEYLLNMLDKHYDSFFKFILEREGIDSSKLSKIEKLYISHSFAENMIEFLNLSK